MKLIVFIKIINMMILFVGSELIITKVEINTLGIYFSKLQKYARDNSNLEDTYFNLNISNYCDMLRRASIYEHEKSANETQVELPVSVKTYSLGNEIWQEEMEQTNLTHDTSFRIGKYYQAQQIPSFRCSDFHEVLRLFVAPAFIPHSAFLFSYDQNFIFVMDREVRGRGNTAPVLVAIIDEVGRLSGNGNWKKDFHKLIKNPSFLNQDLLCKLDRVLQSRLCAASYASFARPRPRITRINALNNENILSPYEYKMPYLYKYYWSQNNEDNCPSLEIKDVGVSMKMLRCSFYSYSAQMHVVHFLKLNMKNTKNVWVFLDFNNSAHYFDLKIPMLKYLKHYKKAFQDITQQ